MDRISRISISIWISIYPYLLNLRSRNFPYLFTHFLKFSHSLTSFALSLRAPSVLLAFLIPWYDFRALNATSPPARPQPVSVLLTPQNSSPSSIFAPFILLIPSKYLLHYLHAFHTTCIPSVTPTYLPYHLHTFCTTYTSPAPLTCPPHRLHTFNNHLHAIAVSAIGISRHVDMVETQRPAFVGNLESSSR
jgi:hypothetical protein